MLQRDWSGILDRAKEEPIWIARSLRRRPPGMHSPVTDDAECCRVFRLVGEDRGSEYADRGDDDEMHRGEDGVARQLAG